MGIQFLVWQKCFKTALKYNLEQKKINAKKWLHCNVQLGNAQKKMHRTNLNTVSKYLIQNNLENVEKIQIFPVRIPDLALNPSKESSEQWIRCIMFQTWLLGGGLTWCWFRVKIFLMLPLPWVISLFHFHVHCISVLMFIQSFWTP